MKSLCNKAVKTIKLKNYKFFDSSINAHNYCVNYLRIEGSQGKVYEETVNCRVC